MQKPTRWIRIERRIVESIRNLNSSCWFQVENEQEKKNVLRSMEEKVYALCLVCRCFIVNNALTVFILIQNTFDTPGTFQCKL